MLSKIKNDSKGQGLVEYGLILALVSVFAVGSLRGVEEKVTSTFESVDNAIVGDTTNAPGPKELIAGSMEAGFFGEVPATELWTGDALAKELGITEGTSQFSNEPWLKFAINNKIIFKSKKSYRHSISWDNLNNKGAVDGSRVIGKGNDLYYVRLMGGYNPSVESMKLKDINHGSEWNRLMLPINVKVKDNDYVYKSEVEIGMIPSWIDRANGGIGYSDGDLNVDYRVHREGSYHWMREKDIIDRNKNVCRGFHCISTSSSYHSSDNSSDRGWSPVLEYIDE